MDWIGLNYLNEILDNQDEKSNIFIISHKQELAEQAIPHLRFEKKGNFTTMRQVND